MLFLNRDHSNRDCQPTILANKIFRMDYQAFSNLAKYGGKWKFVLLEKLHRNSNTILAPRLTLYIFIRVEPFGKLLGFLQVFTHNTRIRSTFVLFVDLALKKLESFEMVSD